ncbi:rhotekin-like [Limulus polyphemus]|uniref:Rhotekin-like n=1 Tax=Limulus polyphemus TaxID=6850 RepID=A0ABM1T530_LIMPO|nr:rhotekin-like [Limulus polyphemus]
MIGDHHGRFWKTVTAPKMASPPCASVFTSVGSEVSRGNTEYDLEHKIDLEIKMREGTTKLLAACKHPMQSLEAAKSLLTSNERMTAYMGELQRRKTNEKIGNPERIILHADPLYSVILVDIKYVSL